MSAHASSHHLEPGSDALQQAAATAFGDSGLQWTELRALVFRILAASADPSSAYTIAERVSAAANRRIAANSVYRILDLFVAHDLAKRIESRNAYVVNRHPSCRHDCIFLVCEACGAIHHLDDDQLARAMRGRAEGAGFRPQRAVLELLGRCADCRPPATDDQLLP